MYAYYFLSFVGIGGGWAQPSNAPSARSDSSSKPRVEIHCAARMCTWSIDPSSFPPAVQADLARHGVDLSRPILVRKWAGGLPERTCYTIRSYLMAREDLPADLQLNFAIFLLNLYHFPQLLLSLRLRSLTTM
jgi:hypothetical protein